MATIEVASNWLFVETQSCVANDTNYQKIYYTTNRIHSIKLFSYLPSLTQGND